MAVVYKNRNQFSNKLIEFTCSNVPENISLSFNIIDNQTEKCNNTIITPLKFLFNTLKIVQA